MAAIRSEDSTAVRIGTVCHPLPPNRPEPLRCRSRYVGSSSKRRTFTNSLLSNACAVSAIFQRPLVCLSKA